MLSQKHETKAWRIAWAPVIAVMIAIGCSPRATTNATVEKQTKQPNPYACLPPCGKLSQEELKTLASNATPAPPRFRMRATGPADALELEDWRTDALVFKRAIARRLGLHPPTPLEAAGDIAAHDARVFNAYDSSVKVIAAYARTQDVGFVLSTIGTRKLVSAGRFRWGKNDQPGRNVDQECAPYVDGSKKCLKIDALASHPENLQLTHFHTKRPYPGAASDLIRAVFREKYKQTKVDDCIAVHVVARSAVGFYERHGFHPISESSPRLPPPDHFPSAILAGTRLKMFLQQ